MPQTEFEPAILVFVWSKTVRELDREAIGTDYIVVVIIIVIIIVVVVVVIIGLRAGRSGF
jgi:hypothetical protein